MNNWSTMEIITFELIRIFYIPDQNFGILLYKFSFSDVGVGRTMLSSFRNEPNSSVQVVKSDKQKQNVFWSQSKLFYHWLTRQSYFFVLLPCKTFSFFINICQTKWGEIDTPSCLLHPCLYHRSQCNDK